MLRSIRPVVLEQLRRFTYLVPPSLSRRIKGRAELFYWKAELERYRRWYGGQILHGVPSPLPEQQVTGHAPQHNAILTWLRLVQFPRYLTALDLGPEELKGLRVLDIGCGPMANLLVFEGCERHGVDPLIDRYRRVGFPFDLWESQGFIFTVASAERLPFDDAFFDVVVSVNAIDHVDDFGAVAREVRRVLKPGGRFRAQVNYHQPTVTEPVMLDDEVVKKHFSWATDLRKLRDEPHPVEQGERLTLWAAGPS